MADIAVPYNLVTPGPDIAFNTPDGDGDMYYLTNIRGLDGVPRRFPTDRKPQDDGALVHRGFKEGRPTTWEGALLIEHNRPMNDIETKRNSMEATLVAALDAIYQVDGTISWTPLGQGAKSLIVRNHAEVNFDYAENYLLKTFAFGLFAADPDF